MTKNSKTLGQCILDCNDDNSCESDCVNTFKIEYSECPCQVSSSSQNTFFKSFQDKCPLGCPCDNYDCDLPEKKAILALYTRDFKPSVLIQPNGGITEGFEFYFDDETEVVRSCSALLNGELYVFGGSSQTRQV